MHGFGAVLVPGSELPYHERWEPRVFALWAISEVDELGAGSGRRLRETMPPDEYLRASYYERWLWSNERRLLARGTVAPGEIAAWEGRLEAGDTPPVVDGRDQTRRVLNAARAQTSELGTVGKTVFQPGDAVRVLRMHPAGHTRCPRYVRGAQGLVDAIRGTYPLPDDGPRRHEIEPVYSVAFSSDDVFGVADEPAWRLYLDLQESYLEAA
jgi:nitrile hydratase